MRPRRRFRSRRGQSLVEFALVLPVIMFMVLGMIEMGFAISHNTSIVTATRQGARVGSELVNGSSVHHCGDSTNAASVDGQIIAAVEGTLASPGSPVSVSQVSQIDIFEVDEKGNAVAGHTNPWVSAVKADGSPNGDILPGSPTGQKLYFKSNGIGWAASLRCGASPAHGLGVRVTYAYKFITPLGSVLSTVGTLFSSGKITVTDQTIMALEPPSP